MEEVLGALCDMVGQHCMEQGVVPEGLTQSDAEAIRVLVKHGYLVRDGFVYRFTKKAGVWYECL